MRDLIRLFYQYNTWATEQLLQSLEQLSPDEYNAPGCSGHGSIRDTLGHFLTTQWGWFCWFDGSMTVQQSISVKVKPEDTATIALARERWRSVDKQARDLVDNISEQRLLEDWSFTLPNGFSASLPLWKMIFHVANHGTHTRAQIIAAIRRNGKNPGNIEMLNYFLTHK